MQFRMLHRREALDVPDSRLRAAQTDDDDDDDDYYHYMVLLLQQQPKTPLLV
jgi:hypothetical protein